MKAVNLLPPELRGTPKTAAAAPAVGGDGTGAFVVLGVLAALVVAFAGYVLTNNTVAERKSELAAATQQQEAAARATAQLKPYADFETLVNARVQTVTDLATSRFDWEMALRDLSRALPSDVTLTSLKGTVSSTASGGGGNSMRGAIDVPAVELAGCSRSQTTVARLMARLRNVDGVTRVSLSKSDKDTVVNSSRAPVSGGAISPACGKGNPPAFEVVAFFEGKAAAAVDPAGVAANATAPAAGATTATATATPTASTDTQPGGSTAPTGTTAPTTPVSTGDAK
jgi:Tfp pilus assembly protein PilN